MYIDLFWIGFIVGIIFTIISIILIALIFNKKEE